MDTLVAKFQTKPFIKWVGGKTSIVQKLIKKIPEYESYCEPFIGSGALLFNLHPHNAFISDSNSKLIATYQAIKENVDEVIELLHKHKKKSFKRLLLSLKRSI